MPDRRCDIVRRGHLGVLLCSLTVTTKLSGTAAVAKRPPDKRGMSKLGDATKAALERMGTAVEEIDGSHTAFIAQPVRAAAFIGKIIA